MGPQTKEADAVHSEKYRNEGETFKEAMTRVASALQDNRDHFDHFRDILLDMRFMPAGRVQAAMGSVKNVTPYNCFVSATIHDSFVDGPKPEEFTNGHPPVSIMQAATEAATTMRQGGGIGYDFSTLRPKGDLIAGVQATTDGPLAFAHIFNAVCKATSSAGNRRGAQMLVMRCDHPDIEAFIRAKNSSRDVPYEYRPLTGFNMSIGITDELMRCVESGDPFELKFNGKVYGTVDAAALWETIMRSTYDWAEPGVLFIDRINDMNNLHYCETIAATNPCGEQPLPPYGACLLGSFNLVKYLRKEGERYTFDWDQLGEDIPYVVRSMDNIVDRARYPLPQQEIEAKSKRRMGLGVTGLANCIEAIGFGYGSDDFLEFEDKIMHFLTRNIYLASCDLADEKGAFPLFDRDEYLKSGFIQTLDKDVQKRIKISGIRNSHLTSIAPTGTISFSADNVSSGIEPVYDYLQSRVVKLKGGDQVMTLEDYGKKFLGVEGRTAARDVTPEEHVKVLAVAQRYVDSACSKTCNVPTDYGYEKFKDLYMQAWKLGAKGCTTYRDNGNYPSVISSKTEDDELHEEGSACEFDPVTGRTSCE